MAFEAGRLDVRVTLVRRALRHDGAQKIEDWSPLGTRLASRRPVAGGEREEGDGRRSFSRYSLWLHKDSVTAALTAADAVVMNGERFELLEPAREVEMFRRRGIELLVESTGEPWAN